MLTSQTGKFKRPGFEPFKVSQGEADALLTKVIESDKLQGYQKLQTGKQDRY